MEHLETKASFTVSEAGEVEGLAWPFGTPDRVGDEILKGAFSQSKTPIPMLDTHNQSAAIGVWDSITETDQGLQVKGRLLIDDVARAREVRALIREKALTGLSIGFITKQATPRKGGGRIISALDLAEISICAIPAHPQARITSAKSIDMKENPMDDKPQNTQDNKIDINADSFQLMNQSEFDTKKLTDRLNKLEAKMQLAGTKSEPQEDEQKALEVKAFGTYLRHGKSALDANEQKALTVGDSAQAGYLVPPEFGSEIIKLLREVSPIRQYANVQTMSGAEIRWPRRKESTKAYWVEEIAERQETDMSFEQVAIKPYEMATYVDISKQLMEDNAYNLEGELQADLATSFAITESKSFVTGTGTGQPKGLLTSTEIKGMTAAAINGDNLIDLMYSLPTYHSSNGVWLMNRSTMATVRKLKDNQGNYLWQEGIQLGQPALVLGRPVAEIPDMPNAEAGKTPIIFGDLSGYRIMDRVGFEIMADPYTLAKVGQVRFYARRRVGADVTHPDRITKMTIAAGK